MKWKCHFDDSRECKNEIYYRLCEFQPDADEKKNGEKPPAAIDWRTEYGMTVPCCPSCGEMAYSTERCVFCGQRLIDTREKAARKPMFEGVMEREVCIQCPERGGNLEDMSELLSHMDGVRIWYELSLRVRACMESVLRTLGKDIDWK